SRRSTSRRAPSRSTCARRRCIARSSICPSGSSSSSGCASASTARTRARTRWRRSAASSASAASGAGRPSARRWRGLRPAARARVASLWASPLGHRVPELDAALRNQLGRVAHSTMLGNGNTATIELAEALAPRVPVDDPRFLFASDGAAAVEQAIRIAFQFWANQRVSGKTGFLALGATYHGDTFGALSLGDGGFYAELFA